jgi:uncharacterized membrane protein
MIPLAPEKLFVLIASIFGLVSIVLTPPFQSPDENRHFYRAYQVSEGTFISTKIDNRVGGFLPEKVRDCVIPYGPLRGRAEIKISRDTIWNSFLNPGSNKRVFIDFPASSVYSPVSYIPQALGIALTKPLGATPIMSLYAARLMTLICWIFAIFLAIRATPIFNWLFVALALLPMSIFIHSSLNADMMTNAFAFLFIAFILKSAFSETKISKKEFLVLLLIIVLLSSAKLLYAPLVLLFLMIPIRNFSGGKQFFLRFMLISFVALATPVFWYLIQGNGYVSYSEYNADYREYVNLVACANLKDQFSFIVSHGASIFEVLANSIVRGFRNYSQGYIGNFGWCEVPLPGFLVVAAYAFLLLVTWTDGKSTIQMSGIQRIILLVPFSLIFFLVLFSQYLIWACVGADEVTNLQGRYFIPIVPLLFVAQYGSKQNFARFLPLGVALFSITALTISSFVIYNRYYVPIEYAIERVICDHETINGNSQFETSNPSYDAENAFSRSSESARSGEYSSKISGVSPFGTMIKFEDCKYGDVLYVEAWKLGVDGRIVVSDEG